MPAILALRLLAVLPASVAAFAPAAAGTPAPPVPSPREEQAAPAQAEKSAAGAVWPAVPIVRKIAPGLAYVRAACGAGGELALPGEPQGDHADSGGFVFDLRYAAGGSGGEREAVRVGEWLAKWAAAGVVPILILVNAETSPVLCLAAAQFAQTHAAVLIGPASAAASPDIVLPIDPAQERAAYAALAASAPEVAPLIGEGAVANKPRYDEAAVIVAHAAPAGRKTSPRDSPRGDSGGSVATPAPELDRASPPPASRAGTAQSPQEHPATSAEAGSASPIDLSLQRAIYLHRAWRALKLHP